MSRSLSKTTATESGLELLVDVLLIMAGVWLVDQGIDAVQLGFWNTFLVAVGLEVISGPLMYEVRH